jgi:hypothetical protein
MVLMALPAPALAASDDYGSATALTYGVRSTGNSSLFTIQPAEPGTANQTEADCALRGRTAWWRVTGHGARMTVTTAGTVFAEVLAVYERSGSAPGPRLACTDANASPLTLTFQTARAKEYLVQVGGKGSTPGCPNTCADSGVVAITAHPERPPNDDRAAAQTLATAATPDADNTGATQEAGETLTCNGVPYAATLWFRWQTPVPGTAVFEADAAFHNVTQNRDTVLAIYDGATGAHLGCDNDGGGLFGPSRTSLRVRPGSYLIQVGARGPDGPFTGQGPLRPRVLFTAKDDDLDGVADPPDCDDSDPRRRQGAAEVLDDGIDQDCDGADGINLDRDGDGYHRAGGSTAVDCRDDRTDINPGLWDVPRNGVNEDCVAGDAPFPNINSAIRIEYAGAANGRRIARLLVQRAAKRSRVEIRCRGKSCPRKRYLKKVRKAKRRLHLERVFKKAVLAAGTVLEVRVTKPETLGRVRRDRLKARRIDSEQLCLDPRRVNQPVGFVDRKLRPRAERRGEECG